MNSVAAEIAQEVGVFLQHQDLDSGARQQIPQHHSGGPAARDAAGSLWCRHLGHPPPRTGSRHRLQSLTGNCLRAIPVTTTPGSVWMAWNSAPLSSIAKKE